MNQDVQRILAKFWAGTATEAERQWLAGQLDAREPDWQQALRREFGQAPDRPEYQLTEAQSARVLSRLRRQLPAATLARGAWHGWGRWAAAAGVALAVGLGAYRYAGSGPHQRPVAVRPPVPAAHLVSQENKGPGPLRLALADGSVVTLQPHGTLTYAAPFGAAGRNLRLAGTALFAVAKDKQHPFTVEAGGFTTTALGTRFWVRATEPNRVAVQLLEGKVVVRTVPGRGRTMPDKYLTPGQELAVNTLTNQVRIRSFLLAAPPAPLVVVIPVPAPGLSFSKAALPAVFSQVERRYHVRIAYDPAEVRGLSFSGTFKATDKLPVVLRTICALNNLSFRQAPGRVIIRKAR